MSKTNAQGFTAKEVKEICERLHGGPSNPNVKKKDEPEKGGAATKEQLDEIINRLFQKDPQQKKKELADKAEQARQKERPENMGFQAKEKEEIEDITKRLFIADYVNRNVLKDGASTSGKTVSADEMEAIVNRLFIANYTNKNIADNKAFYDNILNKKKGAEKVLSKDECDETTTRLHKMTRQPAESNKELRGTQTYAAKGIYGTYAMTAADKVPMFE